MNPGIAGASQHMAFVLLNKSAANIHDYGRRMALFAQLAERLSEGADLVLEAAHFGCAGTQEARLLGCLGGIGLRLAETAPVQMSQDGEQRSRRRRILG